jgi:AcrR family transcriptional regulator
MGTKDRKEREKEFRKLKIIKAASDLISVHGFDHVTMEEIAHRAELSKGTLYLYFDDKLSLFIEIKRKALEQIHRTFLEVLKKDEPGAELVKDMSMVYLDFLNTNPIYTQALLNPEIAFSAKHRLKQEGQQLITLITHAIQIGVQDKSIRSSLNPRILALQVGWCMFGILQFFITDSSSKFKQILVDNDTDLKSMVKQYIDTLLNNPVSNLQQQTNHEQ